MQLLKDLYLFRKSIITIVAPLILSPLLFCTPIDDKFVPSACAYSILLMSVFWVTEVVPLAITALLPLVLYPLFGILGAKQVSLVYLKDINVLFLGGLTVAVAVEHWNLHKRIALKVLTLVGAKPRWLLFGFMVTTAFLSMWISNVATTAMMIPIAQAVLDEMNSDVPNDDEKDSGCNTPEEQHRGSIEMKYSAEQSALGAEMGNIGDAQKLGKRLASYDEDEIPKWAFNETKKRHRSGGEVKYEKIQMRALDEEDVAITIMTGDGGPDASTDLLVGAPENSRKLSSSSVKSVKKPQKHLGLCKALTICICYAANIGGTATLTGTGPNGLMAGSVKSTFEDAPAIDFGAWVVFALPGMLIFLMLAWIWLQYLFLHLSYAEKSVLTLFTILVLLWLTKSPGFVKGWGSLPIFRKGYVTDATMAMTIAFLLFVLPSERPNIFCWKVRGSGKEGPVPPLLTWPVLHQKMAWNVILLLGGGFAMAAGSKASGLSGWIADQLTPLKELPAVGTLFICCLVICALTQCTSNTATATIFFPILSGLALTVQVNPLYFLLPATVTTSYAFMLPVSTPPNAIAYSYGHLSMTDMMKAGFPLNIIGILVVVFSTYSFGDVAFDVFTDCPEWVHSAACDIVRNATMPVPLNNSSLL